MTWEEFGFLAASGGGIDLDVITANPADVRAGKVIVDKDGEPLTGTLPDRGSWGVAELAAVPERLWQSPWQIRRLAILLPVICSLAHTVIPMAYGLMAGLHPWERSQ